MRLEIARLLLVLLTRALLSAGHHFGSRPLAVDQAARLAAELAQLLDQMATEQVGFEGLAEIAGDKTAAGSTAEASRRAFHWQGTFRRACQAAGRRSPQCGA